MAMATSCPMTDSHFISTAGGALSHLSLERGGGTGNGTLSEVIHCVHLKYSLKRLDFRKLDGMYTIGRGEVDADGQKSLGGLGPVS